MHVIIVFRPKEVFAKVDTAERVVVRMRRRVRRRDRLNHLGDWTVWVGAMRRI